MKRLKETVATMYWAAKYSFGFCWRNSRKETIGRLIVSAITTLSLYLGIYSTGLVINKVQELISSQKPGAQVHLEVFASKLIPSLVFLGLVLLVGVVLGRLNWFYRSKWNMTLRYANQRELNNHRATLDIARFRSKEYDDLQKRIEELPTSWQTRIWFSDEMFNLLATMISFGLFGASLIWYKPVYAIFLVLVALPMMVVEFKLGVMWWNLAQELVPHHKKRSVLEKPYKHPTAFIQALTFNQMPALGREIDLNIGSVLDAYDHIRRLSFRQEFITHSIAILGLCAVMAHLVWSTVVDGGAIGTLTIVMAAAKTFQGNLEAIVSLVADQWNSAKGVILIERDFLGLKPLLKTEYPVIPDFSLTPRIRFEGVSFSYPDAGVEVLKNVTFSIEPGSKLAIVGKSGNGKTTIQALLMRQYDPTSGAIFAGDVNLRNIEPQVWCKVASALTQEYTVLERRIGEEIASSCLDQAINLNAVSISSRFANFDEVVDSDPDGYQSQIGVEFGGRDFSGGEKQRLALARVHYRGTPVLILDEPDARLDPDSAQKVMDQVFALQGVTVVVITHHVSRAERCDNIIVMGKGEIVEEGTHEELVTNGGVYASMYEKDRERLGSS
jgi:ATP-binding cassette subfamily B protein